MALRFAHTTNLSFVKHIFRTWYEKPQKKESMGTSSPVMLKREPLDSLREEFLIPGRKFVPARNWVGKAVDEKTLSFIISLFNKCKNRTARLV